MQCVQDESFTHHIGCPLTWERSTPKARDCLLESFRSSIIPIRSRAVIYTNSNYLHISSCVVLQRKRRSGGCTVALCCCCTNQRAKGQRALTSMSPPPQPPPAATTTTSTTSATQQRPHNKKHFDEGRQYSSSWEFLRAAAGTPGAPTSDNFIPNTASPTAASSPAAPTKRPGYKPGWHRKRPAAVIKATSFGGLPMQSLEVG